VLERARSIAAEVDGLVQRARWIEAGDIGQLRVGLGSGPGALLMTPLLTHMAVHHPGVKTTIVRGGAEQQLQQLREGELDALVVDVRRVPPHPDWLITDAVELPAGFVVRAQHPLAQVAGVSWAQLMAYPVASTPLSDEVARLLVGTYGPQANPVSMVSLRCEEIASLLDTVVQTDAIFLGILAAANEGVRQGRLVVLDMAQPLRATARFALVSLARRTAGPGWSLLRTFFERQVVTPYGLGTIPG
jgi:DNA-binding transcriptional LysR family regulator